MFGSDGRVYYLASGQLVATSPGTSDADAVFPTADARRIPGDPLASGGFTWAQPAPGLGSVAAVMRLERGSAFLLQPPSGDAHAGHDHAPGEGHEGEAAQNAAGRPLFLGLGQDVLAAWLPDNTVVVVFRNGTPTGQPIPLPTGGEWERMLPDTEGMRDSALVRFDATGRPLSVVPLPFSPTGLAVSQDGAQAALTVEEGPVGVFVLPIAGGDARRVHDRAAQSPSWSPDGRTVAFASEQDIWTVPTDGSAAATNLTKDGKNNAAPAWSPAAPKA